MSLRERNWSGLGIIREELTKQREFRQFAEAGDSFIIH
jgi:hypothetical protein